MRISLWHLVALGFLGVLLGGMYLRSYMSQTQFVQSDIAIPVQEYVSTQAGIRMKFDQPFFVTETQTQQAGMTRGDIVISTIPGGDEAKTNIAIVYGIPYIDGKGGACADENGVHWKKMIILEETIDVCDVGLGFHAGYPKNKTKDVEYSFFIGGEGITQGEYDSYKNILTSGLFYISK